MKRQYPRPQSQRQLRVGENIRHALSVVLNRGELRDPALSGRSVTVTEVRCSPDLRNATVFVVPLGGGDEAEVLDGLQHAAPYLRGVVNGAVVLKYSPRLVFEYDRPFDEAGHIQDMLDDPKVARDLAHDPGSGDDGAA